MAETYFPFNSVLVDGVPDRPGNAESLSSYLAAFFSNGILLAEDDALKVSVDAGMSLSVYPGACVIDGRLYKTDEAVSVDLTSANATLSRIDRVVVRLDLINRLMELAVLEGTPASSPVAAELTRNAAIYEMCLAEIAVDYGVSNLTAANITDTRLDADLCGISSMAEHVQDVEHGGTGAKNAKDARENLGLGIGDAIENLLTLPNNTSPSADTPNEWEKLGTCKIYYNSSSGNVVNKPTIYGTLINIVGTVKVTQIWFRQAYGTMYVRAGNATGWDGTSSISGADAWKKIFDDTQTIPLKNGGLGRKDITLSSPHAILRAPSNWDEYPYISTTPTAKGVMYATETNGAPKFGNVPLNLGGVSAKKINVTAVGGISTVSYNHSREVVFDGFKMCIIDVGFMVTASVNSATAGTLIGVGAILDDETQHPSYEKPLCALGSSTYQREWMAWMGTNGTIKVKTLTDMAAGSQYVIRVTGTYIVNT